MKLTHFDIFHYRLPLARPLTSGDSSVGEREGMLLRVRESSGAYGWGECAPMASVNVETTDIALDQLKELRTWAFGRALPVSLTNLDGDFDRWLNKIILAPSVRCAFETACLQMVAMASDRTLVSLLGGEASGSIKVNGLIDLSQRDAVEKAAALRESGYEAFKLKVGRQTIEQDIVAVHEIRQAVGGGVALRLDANQLWTAQSLLAVWNEVQPCDIDYFEEPVPDISNLLGYLDKREASLPLGLDESLTLASADELAGSPHVTALVMKPTALGLERTAALTSKAREAGKTAVISSAFESSVGMSALVQVAAALADPDVAMGLDTGRWLEADLLSSPVASEHGRIAVDALPAIPKRIRSDFLTEMICDE